MDERKRYFRLGLFVVVTLAILTGVLFVLGGRSLFQPSFTFETYFDSSIAGLDLGASVKFRGVPLGQVIAIVGSGSTYEANVPLEKRKNYIVVRAKVATSPKETEQFHSEFGTYVKRGLRAQTELAGITGQQYLGLDFLDPAKYPPLPFNWQPENPYIPSAPSVADQIVANAQGFLASLNQANIKQLGQSLNALVANANRKLDEVQLQALSAEVVAWLKTTRQAVDHLDRILVELGKNMNTLLANANRKLEQVQVGELSAEATALLKTARETIDRMDRVIAGAPIDETVRSLSAASARLQKLLQDPGLQQTVENIAAVTARLRKIAEAGDLDRVVRDIDEAIQRLGAILGDNQYDVRVVIQDLRATAANLRALSETIKQYPAGALLGGPPAKVELPRESQ